MSEALETINEQADYMGQEEEPVDLWTMSIVMSLVSTMLHQNTRDYVKVEPSRKKFKSSTPTSRASMRSRSRCICSGC